MRECLNPINTINFLFITMALTQDFTFEDNPLLPNLTCPRCQLVFREPTRLHRCGHTFCEDCCPLLLQPCHSCCILVEAKQPDLIASSLISDLAVICTAPDCPFQGTL